MNRLMTALVAAAAPLALVAGLGALITAPRSPEPSEVPTAHAASPASPATHVRRAGDPLARLESYARTIGSGTAAPPAEATPLLPDVGTLIDRLAARLKASPEDIEGWRMLGWSSFQLGRYADAAAAYARAVALDPASNDLRTALAEARARAADKVLPRTPGGATDTGGTGRP